MLRNRVIPTRCARYRRFSRKNRWRSSFVSSSASVSSTIRRLPSRSTRIVSLCSLVNQTIRPTDTATNEAPSRARIRRGLDCSPGRLRVAARAASRALKCSASRTYFHGLAEAVGRHRLQHVVDRVAFESLHQVGVIGRCEDHWTAHEHLVEQVQNKPVGQADVGEDQVGFWPAPQHLHAAPRMEPESA
jgi:hypothetical protein